MGAARVQPGLPDAAARAGAGGGRPPPARPAAPAGARRGVERLRRHGRARRRWRAAARDRPASRPLGPLDLDAGAHGPGRGAGDRRHHPRHPRHPGRAQRRPRLGADRELPRRPGRLCRAARPRRPRAVPHPAGLSPLREPRGGDQGARRRAGHPAAALVPARAGDPGRPFRRGGDHRARPRRDPGLDRAHPRGRLDRRRHRADAGALDPRGAGGDRGLRRPLAQRHPRRPRVGGAADRGRRPAPAGGEPEPGPRTRRPAGWRSTTGRACATSRRTPG